MNSRAAIVAGHGEFAEALISAVIQITGRSDLFVPMTNRGLSAEDIERTMRLLVDERDVRVIFTDLPAGSCTVAARRVLRDRTDLVLVTGANLPALLDFVFHEEMSPLEAAQRATEKGKGAMTVVGAPRGN
jgi:PTS system N-acetylgalactosamine-specific IIA component